MGQLDTEVEALDVQVLGPEVVLIGRGMAIALSAAAAAETARRLADAAATAGRSAEVATYATGHTVQNAHTADHRASHTRSRDE